MSCTEDRFSLPQFAIESYQYFLFPPADETGFEEVSCFKSTVSDLESIAATNQPSGYESLDVSNSNDSNFEAYIEKDFARHIILLCIALYIRIIIIIVCKLIHATYICTTMSCTCNKYPDFSTYFADRLTRTTSP